MRNNSRIDTMVVTAAKMVVLAVIMDSGCRIDYNLNKLPYFSQKFSKNLFSFLYCKRCTALLSSQIIRIIAYFLQQQEQLKKQKISWEPSSYWTVRSYWPKQGKRISTIMCRYLTVGVYKWRQSLCSFFNHYTCWRIIFCFLWLSFFFFFPLFFPLFFFVDFFQETRK